MTNKKLEACLSDLLGLCKKHDIFLVKEDAGLGICMDLDGESYLLLNCDADSVSAVPLAGSLKLTEEIKGE